MGIVHSVRDCPRNETEWKKASDRLNCTSGDESTMNKYHCLPADNRTTLLEFCYTRRRTQVVKGTHTVLSKNITHGFVHSDLVTLYNYVYINFFFVQCSEYGQFQIQIIFAI